MHLVFICKQWILYDNPKRSYHWSGPYDYARYYVKLNTHKQKLIVQMPRVIHYLCMKPGSSIHVEVNYYQLDEMQKLAFANQDLPADLDPKLG